MQTIKTAVVVVMLLAVLYGAYVALNGSDTPLPKELDVGKLEVDFGSSDSLTNSIFPASGGSTATNGGFNVQSQSAPRSNPFPAVGSQSSSSPPPLMTSTPSPPTLGNSPEVPNTLDTKDPLGPPSLSESAKSLAPPSLANGNSASSSGSSPFGLKDPSPSSSMPALPDLGGSTLRNGAPTLSLPDQHGREISTLNEATQAERDLTAPALPSMLGANTNGGGSGALDEKSVENDPRNIAPSTTSKSFANAKKMALEQFQRGDLKEALSTLSLFYNAPELTHDQHQELLEMLDPLSGEVIYSRRHLLDSPHIVAQGETLEAIAKKYEVPMEILGRINAIDNPYTLQPGTRLKVIQGPFRAEVDLTRSELTLFLGDLYAGRFAVSQGLDPVPKEGSFQVVNKQQNRTYYGSGGTQINGGDPRNPYGGWWIDLDQDMCIHGTPEQSTPEIEKLGCISLSPIDASDVFGMLSRGSKVLIRR